MTQKEQTARRAKIAKALIRGDNAKLVARRFNVSESTVLAVKRFLLVKP